MTKEKLKEILINSSSLSEVYVACGYTSNPNSRTRDKVKQLYLDNEIDLVAYFGPKQKKCPVCEIWFTPSKSGRGESTTCSYRCANTYFRSGQNHPNYKGNNYRTICFSYHKKECIVCKESNIVEVHHLDEDSTNNNPNNLIPLCPTHHKYWHSKYKHLVEPVVTNYITNWIGKQK